jgi:hypothetical protein
MADIDAKLSRLRLELEKHGFTVVGMDAPVFVGFASSQDADKFALVADGTRVAHPPVEGVTFPAAEIDDVTAAVKGLEP